MITGTLTGDLPTVGRGDDRQLHGAPHVPARTADSPKHRYAATKDYDHDDVIVPSIAWEMSSSGRCLPVQPGAGEPVSGTGRISFTGADELTS